MTRTLLTRGLPAVLTVGLAAILWAMVAPPQLGGQTMLATSYGSSMEPMVHGGDVTIEQEPGRMRLRGSGCPLAATVSRHPEACRALQGLLAEVIGAPVVLCCEREPRPRCCFTVPSAA